jgi:hypothetical protein
MRWNENIFGAALYIPDSFFSILVYPVLRPYTAAGNCVILYVFETDLSQHKNNPQPEYNAGS